MTKNYKKRWGDKRDARLIRKGELDTNHFIMPLVWPRRTDNEAFISEVLDLTAVNEYLKRKNEENTENRYSLFMVLIAALGKVFINRPKMNRFYRRSHLYERYDTTVGFIVKKSLTDDGDEALARIKIEDDDTFDTVCEKIRKEIETCRSQKIDQTSHDIEVLMKLPFFISKMFVNLMKLFAKLGPIPESMSASDIFFTSIAFTNLGSIRLHAGYHHLSNWGTNSFFTTIGEKKLRPFYDKEGNMTLRDSIDLGMTIDERIADGYYFSKTIRILKTYIEHPEILEKPFKDIAK